MFRGDSNNTALPFAAAPYYSSSSSSRAIVVAPGSGNSGGGNGAQGKRVKSKDEDDYNTNSSDEKQQEVNEAVKRLWSDVIMKEIIEVQPGEFKSHSQLPFARIKKIVAADEDVRMVSSEVPVVLARACRMFIMELTLRAFRESSMCSRKTIQREDVHSAVMKMDAFYFFLKDVFDGTIEQERRKIQRVATDSYVQ
jgi:nuclear transcription factor Y gamma